MDANRQREALKVATDCITLAKSPLVTQRQHLSSGTWVQMLEDIISSPGSTPLLRAKAMSLRIQYADEHVQQDRLDQLRVTAIQLFEDVGHVHGAMDLKIRQAGKSIKKDYRHLTDELVEELKVYFRIYETNNAVSPLQAAIGAIRENIAVWQAFDLQLSLNNMTDELAKVAGATLESYLSQVRLLATWLAHSGKSAMVVEGASGLDSLIREEDCRWLKGTINHILAQAYAQLQDFKKSETSATIAVATLGELFPSDRAEATSALLQARLSMFNATRSIEVEGIINFAESEIESDLRNEALRPAIQKMEIIVAQIFVPRRDARRERWLDRMEQTARNLSRTMPEEGDIRIAAICQGRGLALLSDGQPGRSTDDDERSVAHLEEAVALYMKHQRLVEAASTRQMQALALFSMFQKTSAAATLQRCIELVSIAKDAFQAVENTSFIATSTRWHSFYLYTAWLRGWTAGSMALDALQEAEEAWADQRADMTVFATLEAVSRRQQFTSATELRDIYKRAFHICQKEDKVEEVWDWVQRAKARSLSDQLGVGMLIPATIREQVISEPRLWDIVTQEEELTQRIAASEMAVRLRLRGELHALHRRMAEEPVLKKILDLRSGTPATLSQVLRLEEQLASKSSRTNIAFVDWVEIANHIWTIVLRKDGVPQWASCGLTATGVATWKEKWLDAKPGKRPPFEDVDYDEEEDDFPLRSLDRLVAPLRRLTTEEDLLIFCPTGVLHSIPLHALFLSDCTPVILRNPVVYCASLTAFWQCCQRAETTAPTNLPWAMVGVYEKAPDRPFHQKEQEKVYRSLSRLAERHSANTVTGTSATRELFTATIQGSAVCHFHGHCILDREVLADQSLELSDGLLPVRDVFDMKLKSPHITLVACDSASQGVAAGDEPLGLITALLCAGAGSVIGTIWPTASRTGRKFADVFYAELEAQRMGLASPSEAEGGSTFNLAIAVRRTVLELRSRRKTRQPYHWAAFVLHGSWFSDFGKKAAEDQRT